MQFFFLGGEGEGKGRGAWSSRNKLEFLFMFTEHIYFIKPPNFLQIQRKAVWAMLMLNDVLYADRFMFLSAGARNSNWLIKLIKNIHQISMCSTNMCASL